MATADVIQQFLKDRKRRGLLVTSKLAAAWGVGTNYVSMVLRDTKARPFPMHYLDETAAFFGYRASDFITFAEQETQRPALGAAESPFRESPRAKARHPKRRRRAS